ncbi:MAG: hypothetical protein U0559_16295 [Anaerolineae bacterium]
MKRILAVCLFSGFYLFAQVWLIQATPHSPTSTAVCGTITQDTQWLVISSPFTVCASGVTVGPTATLTIQPGVTVQFQQSVNNKLNVQGTLNAIGTTAQPITFTGLVATPGSWAGISADYSVITPALVNLSNVTLEDGGGGSALGQLIIDRATLTLTHSLIRNGGSNGIHFTYQTAGLNVQTTDFVSNTLNAIQIDAPYTDLLLSDLSANNNGTNGVYIVNVSTHIQGQHRWSNPGIPYVVSDGLYNQPGDELTIDPGTRLQFMSNIALNIGGQLKAIGLPDQPITFTAQTQTPGGWRGIVVDGGNSAAVVQLDYATVEYGGSDFGGANIVVNHGQVIAHHSTIRGSAKDGVQFNVGASGSILNSQIISNSQIVTTTYGIKNSVPTQAVLATNNWWGDPNGPQSTVVGCSTGHGDKVTNGVLFRPVLTNTNLSAEFPLSDAPQLTLTPRRWYAPADGTTKVYFDITLRDGNGAPLPGRATQLHTSLGTVVDGGVTDVTGHTLTYLTSNTAGDANVYVTLNAVVACEGAASPTAKVTFTPPVNTTDLFPNSPAPYFGNDLSITPMPIVTGITETIHSQLTNPLSVPITVEVEFAFAQSSIGLLFGPIKDITQTIPASSTINLSADFMPVIAGHYCVQVSYAITAIGAMRLLRPEAGRQLKQFNFNPEQGPTMTPSDKDSLDKADKAFNKVKKLSPRGTNIQQGIVSKWWGWVKDSAKKISKSLGGDPPRQDYNVSTLPVWYRWPHTQPDANISAARAAALNAASDALADVVAYGTAADTALDRYGGASQAKDLTWAAQQANAQIYYEQQMGTALLTYADKLDAFVQVLNDEHESNITVTVGDAISYQQSLAATGFTAQEIADAKLVGLTDADIEDYRQEIIATDPNDLAGNILDLYANEAFVSRNLGNALLHPYAFAPGLTVGGSAGLLQATAATTAISNTLAQIGNTSTTLQLGNPLTQTTAINVSVRRIDLPADWAVDVSPAQVTLAPGEVTTVTVNILTGSPVPQGSTPRVAVEGYAGSQLLGGVVVDVVVPQYLPGFMRVQLPLIRK